jgi:pimeloyl-[acyl-carrier protein] methyl ester esterase
LGLADVLARFEREADRGLCWTGRYWCEYYVWGEGPHLLLVPGMAERGRSFLVLAALLSRHFRCISYNHPVGRGDRAKLSRYTHDGLLADAFALLDHLGVGACSLYGASFGSTIVLRALHARPARFPRGIVQGGFARRPLAPAEYWLARMACHWLGTMRQLPLYRSIAYHVHHEPFAARPRDVWQYYLDDDRPIAAVATHALLVHTTDVRNLLPEIRQPVLIIHAEDDPLVKRDCAEELLRGLPSAHLVELPGCGHFPYFTHPELLAEVVRQFLTPPLLAAPEAACPLAAVCRHPGVSGPHPPVAGPP